MPERIDQLPDQPTPVDLDATATAPTLLARARTDYRQAQARRKQLSREDRVPGALIGGVR